MTWFFLLFKLTETSLSMLYFGIVVSFSLALASCSLCLGSAAEARGLVASAATTNLGSIALATTAPSIFILVHLVRAGDPTLEVTFNCLNGNMKSISHQAIRFGADDTLQDVVQAINQDLQQQLLKCAPPLYGAVCSGVMCRGRPVHGDKRRAAQVLNQHKKQPLVALVHYLPCLGVRLEPGDGVCTVIPLSGKLTSRAFVLGAAQLCRPWAP